MRTKYTQYPEVYGNYGPNWAGKVASICWFSSLTDESERVYNPVLIPGVEN